MAEAGEEAEEVEAGAEAPAAGVAKPGALAGAAEAVREQAEGAEA